MKNCTKKGTIQNADLETFYHAQLIKDLESLAKKQKIQFQDKEQLVLKLIQNTTDKLLQDDDDPKDSLSIKPLFKQSIWKTIFTLPFLQSIENSQNLISLIKQLLILADGHFNGEQISYIEIKKLNRFQGYFTFTQKNISLAFEVGTVIVPEKNTFKISHVMTFIDIKFDRKSFDELYDSAQQFHNSLKFDKLKSCSFKDIKLEQQIIVQKKDRTQYQEMFLFVFVINWPDIQFLKVQRNANIQWIPNLFMDTQIQDLKDLQAREHNYNSIRMSNQIFLNQFVDFTKATTVIELLSEAPEFKFKISEQEREVIRTKNNSITIGRSGTGKTLCQILRIFTIQTFLKLNLRITGLEEERLLVNTYQQGEIGLHCVFTTMNPVLVGEVRKYYLKLQNIVEEILLKNLAGNFESTETMQASLIIRQSVYEQILLIILQDDVSQYKHNRSLWNSRFNSLTDTVGIDKIQKISDLEDRHFPGFLTIQKLLMLIDGSLKKPFFKQDQFQKNFKRTGRAGWDDGSAINISQEFKTVISFRQSILDSSISNITTSNKNIQVIQVDYRYFMTRFWPSMKKTPAQTEDNRGFMSIVWTQIYSIIKGSQYSHLYPDNALPKCIYLRENKDIYDQSTLNKIYDYYLLYEQWKKEKQLFDQMDLVNYIMNQIDAGEYNGTPIHYLTVDEIQDLPHALIELLSKITEQSLQLCGDTAQNIVQGVGFRFQDLKNNFKNQIQAGEMKFPKFDFYQLTVNFRAHNNLLQLANNVVSLLEIFFPKSIDRLHKEISSSPGPKPFVVESQDQNVLISLFGKSFNDKQNEQKIEFGCNQVIIVKNDEGKDKIPKQFQNALILTVYESKGLEFDDVILYNFFTEDTLSCEKWNIINHLFIEEEVLSTNESNSTNLEGCNLTCFQGSEGILIRKLRTKPSFKALDLTFYNELCAELKMLYVAVTRSRKRLIIFDSDTSRRLLITDLWSRLGLINTKLAQAENFLRNISSDQSSSEEWVKTGEMMFNNKYYEQAAKCFKMAKLEKEQQKSQAYADATKAQQLQQEYENENANKKGYNKIRQQMRENYIEKFISAAINFGKIFMLKHSADCYFSALDYKNSLIQYIKCESWIEAAESAEKEQKLLVSGLLFMKADCFEEGFNIIEQTNDILHIMSALIVEFMQIFPLVLNILYDELKNDRPKQQRSILQQITVISDNCENYGQQFQEILLQFENSPIEINSQTDLINQLNTYVMQLFPIFLDIIDKEIIQYDVEKYINAMKQQDDNLNRQYFILDILEYFNSTQIYIMYYQHYKIPNINKWIVTQLFDKKWIYKLQNNTQAKDLQVSLKQFKIGEIINIEQSARDLTKSIESNEQIDIQEKKTEVKINCFFYLLMLGYSNELKYQLFQQINQKIQKRENKLIRPYLVQDLFETCFLFRNFGEPFKSEIHELNREENELLALYNYSQNQKNHFDFNMIEFLKKLEDIDEQGSNIQLDHNYISKAQYLINTIQRCVKGDKFIFCKLKHMNQREAQKFLFFVKLCSTIFKFNNNIPNQKKIFQAMCLQFGIGIPISNSYLNLGQSFTFIKNINSFFNISEEMQYVYCLSFDGETSIISTQKILEKIREFFKAFLKNYAYHYLKIQEKQNDRYLILHYAYTLIQLNNERSKQPTIIKNQIFQYSKYTFFVEITLKKLIKQRTFQVAPLSEAPTRYDVIDIYVTEAMNYFNKALMSENKDKMHKKLYIGFYILNIIHYQANSIQIINQLQSNQETSKLVDNQYFNQLKDYVYYLQSINYCYSILYANNAIRYYNYLIKQQYQSPVQLKDLYIICLNIIFTLNQLHNRDKPNYGVSLTKSIIEIVKLQLKPKTSQKYQKSFQDSQNKDHPNYYKYEQKLKMYDQQVLYINVQDFTLDNQFIDIDQLIIQFIEFLLKQYIPFKDKIFQILLTLLSNISKIQRQEKKILPPSFYLQIEDILQHNIDNTKHQKSEVLQQLLCSFQDKAYNWLNFQTAVEYQLYSIQIFPSYKSEQEIDKYQEERLSKNHYYYEIQQEQLARHITDKFSNLYLASRLILNAKNQQMPFPGEIMKMEGLAIIYLKIDEVRKSLVALLYSKFIQKSINFHSIIHELEYLAAVEKKADEYVRVIESNSDRKAKYEQRFDVQGIYTDLKKLEMSIDTWKIKEQGINKMILNLREKQDIKLLQKQNKYRKAIQNTQFK